MEGLFNERLQIRTRQLQDQVAALHKQVNRLQQHNLNLQKIDLDRIKQVQLLEEQLKTERDRCQKLSVTLSSYRRRMNHAQSINQNRDHCSHAVDCCHSCGKELASFINIIPARIDHMKLQNKRTYQTTPRPDLPINHNLGRNCQILRGDQELDPWQNDLKSVKHMHLVENGASQYSISRTNGCIQEMYSMLQSDQHGINRQALPGKARSCGLPDNDQEVKQFASLTSGGFYVRNTNPKTISPAPAASSPLHESQTTDLLRTIDALKTENHLLRTALLSAKRLEIKELEQHLNEVKESASSRGPSSTQKPTDLQEHVAEFSKMQVDPVKFLDMIREVEQKMSEKSLALLGLQGNQVIDRINCAGGSTVEDKGPNCNHHDLHENGEDPSRFGKVVLGDEDLRDLLKVLARDVVLLRDQNLRLALQLSREAS